MQTSAPNLYMNMSQFSEMKLAAREDSANAGKAAAQQFEGLFIQMMLKNMRSAAIMDESQHSSYMDFYTDMHDKQISMMMAKQGGMGIADLLERQLAKFTTEGKEAAGSIGNELPSYRRGTVQAQMMPEQTLPMKGMDYVASNPEVKTHEFYFNPVKDNEFVTGAEASLVSETITPFYGWDNPNSFVNDLWSHAETAAAKLGVSANVLVAQSALETGWGRHAMKKPDGSIAFNLFGVKSSHGWTGPSVSQNTLEFRQGAMEQETARFRSYDSVSESLNDYVNFIQSNPRYSDALKHGGSDAAYIKGLHKAGYATDPNYSNKVIRIMQQSTFNTALAAMKASSHRLS